MSIKIMSLVWEHGPADKAEVLVLLAIADYCNDDGECWPSVASIARKARMTERGVQKICARLSETGWLQIDLRQGRYGCNLYRIKTPNFMHPEHGSPRTPEHQTPNPVRQNPEPRSPKPSLTIKEPSVTPPKGGGPAFEDFWAKVPQKQDKALAKKEWSKLSSADRRAAKDAVADWYAWFKRVHPDATPTYPVRYLEHRKWEDEGWRPTASRQIQDGAAYWADQINAGRPISRFSVTPTLCEEMISRDLVSRDILRERGLG